MAAEKPKKQTPAWMIALGIGVPVVAVAAALVLTMRPWWVNSSQEIASGPLRVSIVRVQLHGRVGKGNLDGLGVLVRARNTDAEHFAYFPGWGPHDDTGLSVSLSDDLGNQYRIPTASGFLDQPGVRDSRFKPGETQERWLLFEEPLPQAKEFFLSVNGPGKWMRWRIPRSEVVIGPSSR